MYDMDYWIWHWLRICDTNYWICYTKYWICYTLYWILQITDTVAMTTESVTLILNLPTTESVTLLNLWHGLLNLSHRLLLNLLHRLPNLLHWLLLDLLHRLMNLLHWLLNLKSVALTTTESATPIAESQCYTDYRICYTDCQNITAQQTLHSNGPLEQSENNQYVSLALDWNTYGVLQRLKHANTPWLEACEMHRAMPIVKCTEQCPLWNAQSNAHCEVHRAIPIVKCTHAQGSYVSMISALGIWEQLPTERVSYLSAEVWSMI